MLLVQPIESLELPELEPYRTMKRPLDHRSQGIFVAEGEKLVRRLLASDFTVVSILVTREWLSALEPALQARPERIVAYVAPKRELEKLIGFSMYQGLLAIGKVPPPAALESILQLSTRPHLLAAVDGVSNAGNLGVLVRNCTAFGVQALVVGETSSSPYLRRAVRSSMGAIFHLPVVEVTSLTQTLKDLRLRGVRSVAAHPHARERTLLDAELSTDCCVVFGSEGEGISPLVLAACDRAVAIPMQATVDSINVGSASAVVLYEAQRQRGKCRHVPRSSI